MIMHFHFLHSPTLTLTLTLILILNFTSVLFRLNSTVPSPKPVKSVTRLPRSLSKRTRRRSLVLKFPHSPSSLFNRYLFFSYLGRAKKRMLYNRRFKTAVVGFGKKGVINNLFFMIIFLIFSLFFFPFSYSLDESSNEINHSNKSSLLSFCCSFII